MEPSRSDRPLIGRLEVYQALLRRRDEILGGRGGLILLEGETGVGKTTFLEALARESALHDFRVLTARADAVTPAPFQLIREVDRSAQREASAIRAFGPMGLGVPFIPPPSAGGLPLVPHGWFGAGPIGEGPGSATSFLESLGIQPTVQSERTHLMEELADPLLRLAEATPLLVALEDVDRADEGSHEFLLFLVPRIVDRQFWVVATTLPFEQLDPEVRARFERLVEVEGADRHRIRPLNEREVLDFVRWLDPARRVEPENANRWYAQTSGNPLFLEQLLRAARPEEAAGAPVPAEGGEYLRHRIRGLSESERRVLTIHAVLGKRAAFAVLARSTDENEESLAELIERLVHEGLLRETENEVFEFVRDDLREVLYAELTETRRRILHRRVGEAIEAAAPPEIEAVYALARHFSLGRVDPKAVEYNRRAADFATRSFLPGVALLHLERALEAHRRCQPEKASEELDLLIQMVSELRRLGELGRADHTIQSARDRPEILAAATPRQRDLLTLQLGLIRSDQGRWEEANQIVRAQIQDREGHWERDLHLAAVRFAGELAYFRGDYPVALQYHTEGLATARALGDERQVRISQVRYARALTMQPGGLVESKRMLHEAAEALEQMGEKAEASEAHLYVGIALGIEQDLEGARVEFERALRLAEEGSDPRRMGWALFDLADTMHDLQRLGEAERYNRRAREYLERVGDRFGLAQTYIYEGKIRRSQGDYDAAQQSLEHALSVFQEQHMIADELEVILRLGEVDAARGRWTVVRERVEELESRGIAERRPDLLNDFAELRNRIPHPTL